MYTMYIVEKLTMVILSRDGAMCMCIGATPSDSSQLPNIPLIAGVVSGCVALLVITVLVGLAVAIALKQRRDSVKLTYMTF